MVALALALVWPAAAAADEEFEPGGGGDDIAAEDGRLVYFGVRPDGQRGLMEGFGSDARPLGPTAGENEAIARIDLGTDARRRAVAVYEFCSGSACALHRYDFATGRARVALASRKDCYMGDPHIERGVLYFRRPGRRARRGRPGCRSGIFQKRPGRPARRLTAGAYPDFDVSGGVLAFVRNRVLKRGDLSEGIAEVGVDEVRLLRVGARRSRRVAAARYGSNPRYEYFFGTFLSEVSLDEGRVYWLRDNRNAGDTDLVRTPVRGKVLRTKLSREGRDLSYERGGVSGDAFAVDGENVYYLDFNAIVRVTPLPPVFE